MKLKLRLKMHYRGGLTYRHEKLTFLPSIFLEVSTSTEKFLVVTVIRFQLNDSYTNMILISLEVLLVVPRVYRGCALARP